MKTKMVFGFVGVGVVSLLAMLTGSLTVPRAPTDAPLQGDLEHDFGEVWLGDGARHLTHTFHLTNMSSRPVSIVDWAATCGCTAGAVSDPDVSPGEAVDVDVTLTMHEPIRRSERVVLVLDGIGSLDLRVQATARRLQDVFVVSDSILLTTGARQQVTVIATSHDSDLEPPPPSISVPNGVEAVFDGWKQILTLDSSTNRPARWHASVGVSQVLPSPPARGDRMWIKFDTGQEVGIELTGRPWAIQARSD